MASGRLMRSVVGNCDVAEPRQSLIGGGASAIWSRVLAMAVSYAEVVEKACFASRQRVSR